MKSPLHILHLEDDLVDAALVLSALEDDGITCEVARVETRAGFVSALERGATDLILSDYSLPTFDGLTATAVARAGWPEIPVILVSGTLGEELAIDALKSGATDYVLKERLARLAPAVRRAMSDVNALGGHRRLEAQLIEAQKMEVLGQLAGGVAHDFNNILAVILGYCDLLADELDDGSPLKRYTNEIELASQRAVGLTRQLLVFGRKQKVQPIVMDLNAAVVDMDGLLRRLVDEHIAMVTDLPAGIGRIRADPGYIGQVLMNLVVNARDAMPSGGTLTITTGDATLGDEHVRVHPGAPPGRYVMLKVSDTGTGMSDEVKARLFEPFFTTKPKGKGTGLGLSTCQTIVLQSSGCIDVSSEAGRGTTFTMHFPRVEQVLDIAPGAVDTGPVPRGTETLLIVEDDPALRHMARGVLEGLGYQVLSATNGQEGLHVARDHHGPPIRLVVSDVVMPLMGGRVMAEWLTTANPDLKILFTSGYTDDAFAEDGRPGADIAFLPKPYTPRALARRVREMLDE